MSKVPDPLVGARVAVHVDGNTGDPIIGILAAHDQTWLYIQSFDVHRCISRHRLLRVSIWRGRLSRREGPDPPAPPIGDRGTMPSLIGQWVGMKVEVDSGSGMSERRDRGTLEAADDTWLMLQSDSALLCLSVSQVRQVRLTENPRSRSQNGALPIPSDGPE
ncbi:MAG TPA: hypothetical protein VGN26_01790 [Armatimonadota bacterium]